MRKILRFLGGLLGLVLVVGLAFAAYVQARGIPIYPVPQVAAGRPPVPTLAQRALGEKLVRASCADYHLNKQTHALSGHRLLDTPWEFGQVFHPGFHPRHWRLD